MKKVLVAMSGGVDSSFTACLLKQQNFKCTGVIMLLEGSNCGLKNVDYVKQATDVFLIEHMVLNFVEDFKKEIILRFCKAYELGLTPNPCIWCNKHFKFGRLLNYAISNGFDYLATGHYACVKYSEKRKRYLLKRAVDKLKDQTYFLYFLKQAQLARVLFPLGGVKKQQVKEQAKSKGILSANRAESQDICFIKGMRYFEFIKNFTKKTYPYGNFVDENGKVLGQHSGIIHYTVGQRRGLKLALKEPMYVKNIDAKANEVVLSSKANLFGKKIWLKNVNLILFDSFKGSLPVTVKLRYKAVEHEALIQLTGLNSAVVVLQKAQVLPAKGQAVVFYDDEVVVGGGEVA